MLSFLYQDGFQTKGSSVAKTKSIYLVMYKQIGHLLSHSQVPGIVQSFEFLQTLERKTTWSLIAWNLHSGGINTEVKPEDPLMQSRTEPPRLEMKLSITPLPTLEY